VYIKSHLSRGRMHSPQQEDFIPFASEPTITSSASPRKPSSKDITIPSTIASDAIQHLPGPYTFAQDHHDEQDPTTSVSNLSLSPLVLPVPLSERVYMSVYSSSSVDTEHSEYSNPPAQKYRVTNHQNMSRKISPVCTTSRQIDTASKLNTT
jgi:hypothetical protein